MEQKTPRLYPSAPQEKIDLEHRSEKKVNDVSCFSNTSDNFKEMITYFKNKNHKSNKKLKNIQC